MVWELIITAAASALTSILITLVAQWALVKKTKQNLSQDGQLFERETYRELIAEIKVELRSSRRAVAQLTEENERLREQKASLTADLIKAEASLKIREEQQP